MIPIIPETIYPQINSYFFLGLSSIAKTLLSILFNSSRIAFTSIASSLVDIASSCILSVWFSILSIRLLFDLLRCSISTNLSNSSLLTFYLLLICCFVCCNIIIISQKTILICNIYYKCNFYINIIFNNPLCNSSSTISLKPNYYISAIFNTNICTIWCLICTS